MDNKIITLGIFAHANAGKTTITEQLLVHTHVKKEVGRVDHGNTSTDSLKVERDRGISVKASYITIPINDKIIQLIDTPGHVDFSAEVEKTISVLDGAVLVISGVEGVEAQTQVIWNELKKRSVPTIIFVNKMDRGGADFQRTLDELKAKISENVMSLVDIKANQATSELIYTDITKNEKIVKLSEIDDEVMERYCSGEFIEDEYLEERLAQNAKASNLYPVLGGTALNNRGIKNLIDAIDSYLPTYSNDINSEFSGYVYTVSRINGTREVYVKVLKGTLNNRQDILIKGDTTERVRTLTKLNGTERIKADTLFPGEMGIVTGLSSHKGDIIGDSKIAFQTVSYIKPLFTSEIVIADKSKIPDLAKALLILYDEDPMLNLNYKKETGRISLDLMGPLQAEIISNSLLERFNLNAEILPSSIVYKETPSKEGTGYTSYNKYSRVGFEIKPMPRNSGITYKSVVSTDYLFAKYQSQIEKLVKFWCKAGLFGWEVTDMEITLAEGGCDSICSESFDFNIAVPIALMRALKDSGTTILEPSMHFSIISPEEFAKKVLMAMTSRNILYKNFENVDNTIVIDGEAPLSNLIHLPIIIAKITGGKGTFFKEQNGYEVKNDGIVINDKIDSYDPRNEEEFIMLMNGVKEKLDLKIKRR